MIAKLLPGDWRFKDGTRAYPMYKDGLHDEDHVKFSPWTSVGYAFNDDGYLFTRVYSVNGVSKL